MEFLLQPGELVIAYQSNLHILFPETYFGDDKRAKVKLQSTVRNLAEGSRLKVVQPLIIPYTSLPVFEYRMKRHHRQRRLQRFERQLAGRFVVDEIDGSQTDHDPTAAAALDRPSLVSDDADWLGIAEDVKDILWLKKHDSRQQGKQPSKTS